MMKHGGKVLPVHYKFTVPEKNPMVYIGSLKFSLDPKAPFTRVYKPLPTYTSIADDYSEAMGEVARLNPFIRKIGVPADLHLEAKADKSLMELVPAGAGVLFAARGEKDQAFKEYWDCLKYREAPYRAEAHNALAGMYWDQENREEALNHYWLAKNLGYPIAEDRWKCLSCLKRLSRPTIDDY
jgi:tetratricopeptide (TPR) repeat protein